MKARYPGQCAICGALITAGDEISFDGRTKTVACIRCAPPEATLVHVTLAGGDGQFHARFRITGRLDADAFAAYRAALSAGRYAEGSTFLPIEKVAAAIDALQQAGLVLGVAPEVRGAIERARATDAAAVQGAQERAARIDAALAAKGGALYPYQREGIAWLAPRIGALVADDMGLGKTIQALAALPPSAPVIVICPAVAKSVWRAEAAKWRPDFRVFVLEGRGSFRAPRRGEIVCVNFDILPSEESLAAARLHPSATLALQPGTVVIVDEAHAVANSKAARTKRVRALSKAARENGGRCWALTATPLKNRPPELWNVLEVAGLARETFGSWPQFVHAFNGRKGRWGGYEWGDPRPEVADLLRRVSLRRRKVDVLADLPAKTYRSLPAAIDKATAKLCDEALEALGGGAVEAAIEKLLASKLGFKELSAARAALAKAKIPAMLEVVEQYEESGEPLVVFSAYRAPVDLLAGRPGWASITGDTTPEQRGEIVERFQAGVLQGVACTIRAGGVAITLTQASNVLRVDREWNPALNAQAEDRCYRIGQKSAVLVTDLVAEHKLDERIAFVLAAKQALIGASVDASTVQHTSPVEPVELDWAAIESEAAAALREAEAALREAEAARQAALAAANERARQAAEQKQQAARRRAQERVRAAAARRLNEPETEEDAPRRGPTTEIERWALAGLRQLAALDSDRAQVLNGVGFNKADGGIGHALAVLGELTEQEWRLAVRIAQHYPGQIGQVAA